MVADEYTVSGGGSLKLKGVKDSKIEKKKKKKAPKSEEKESVATKAGDGSEKQEENVKNALASEDEKDAGEVKVFMDLARDRGKTRAEQRWEEERKKRLDERLRREGIKTHKERVEELNRYLSNLSEHHDMPRIGPG